MAAAPDETATAWRGAGPRRQLRLERLELGPEQHVTAAHDAIRRRLERVEVPAGAPAHVDDRYHGCAR